MKLMFQVLAALAVIASVLIVGTIAMNYALVEFIGPGAPQPSVAAWTIVWLSIFVIKGAGK